MADDSASSKGTERKDSSSNSSKSSSGRGSEDGYRSGGSSSGGSSSSGKSSSSGRSSEGGDGNSGGSSSGGSDRDDRGGSYNSGYGSGGGNSGSRGSSYGGSGQSGGIRDDRGGSYNSGYGSASQGQSGLGSISDRDWDNLTDNILDAITGNVSDAVSNRFGNAISGFPKSDNIIDARIPSVAAKQDKEGLAAYYDNMDMDFSAFRPQETFDFNKSLKEISNLIQNPFSDGLASDFPSTVNQYAAMPTADKYSWSPQNMEKIHGMNLEDRKLVDTVGPYLAKAFGSQTSNITPGKPYSLGDGIVDGSQYAKTTWGEIGNSFNSPENLASVAQVIMNRSNLASDLGQYGGIASGNMPNGNSAGVLPGFDANGLASMDKTASGKFTPRALALQKAGIGLDGNSAFQSATPGTAAYKSGLDAIYNQMQGTGPQLPDAVQTATNYRANSMAAPKWERGISTTQYGPHTFSNPDPGRPPSTVMASNDAMRTMMNGPTQTQVAQANSPPQNPQVQTYVRNADLLSPQTASINDAARYEPATFSPGMNSIDGVPLRANTQSDTLQSQSANDVTSIQSQTYDPLSSVGISSLQSGTMNGIGNSQQVSNLPSRNYDPLSSIGLGPGNSQQSSIMGSSPLDSLFGGGIGPMDSPVIGPNQYFGDNFAGTFSNGPTVNPMDSPQIDGEEDLDSYYRELPSWDGLPKRADVPLTPGAPGKTDREYFTKYQDRIPSTGEITDPTVGKAFPMDAPFRRYASEDIPAQYLERHFANSADDKVDPLPEPNIDDYAEPTNPNDPTHDVGPEPYDNRGWDAPEEEKPQDVIASDEPLIPDDAIDIAEARKQIDRMNWWYGDGIPNWRPDGRGDGGNDAQYADNSQDYGSDTPAAKPILPPEIMTVLAGLTAEDLQNMTDEERQILEDLLATYV